MCSLLSYPGQPISSLSPGPQQVSFTGVVANLTSHQTNAKSAQAAKGCLKLVVRDESGVVLVKLWYDSRSYEEVRLGQWLRVSTTHISPTVTTGAASSDVRTLPASIVTSIFPEKDSGCGVEVLQPFKCRDLGLATAFSQTGIMNLEDLICGDLDDPSDATLLVVVLEIGDAKTVTTKFNTSFETLNVTVIDCSCQQTSPNAMFLTATLSFNSPFFPSISTFIPMQTVLLISRPKILSTSRRRLKLTPCSQILVSPPVSEASLLRQWTSRAFPALPKAIQHSDEDLPCSLQASDFSGLQSRENSVRRQFTLGLFLEEVNLRQKRIARRPAYWSKFARNQSFVGYLSVLITELLLVDLYRSHQLFCGTCPICSTEVFANSPSVTHLCQRTSIARRKCFGSGPDRERDVNSDNSQDKGSFKMQLAWNNQLLCGFSDESGGLLLPGGKERHNLHLTDQAILGFTGLTPKLLQVTSTKTGDIDDVVHSGEEHDTESDENRGTMLERLCWVEEQVRWARVTMVLAWVLCDKHDTYERHDNDVNASNNSTGNSFEGRIVVLDMLS